VDKLHQHFGLSDSIGEVANMLDNLHMKSGDKISTYNVDFMCYASQLGWGNSVLCHRYYQGLPNWIQDPISTWEQGKPTLFQDMYALAMTINHCYWERDCECHHARQVEKEALESHSWKQGKASTSSFVIASQSKTNTPLVASSAKNLPSKLSPLWKMEYLDGCSTTLRRVAKRVATLEGGLVWFGGGFTMGTLFWTGGLAYDSLPQS